MTRCRIIRLLAGLLLGPPLVWALVVAAVPTECARQRLASALEHKTGRSVRLGRVWLCLGGGITLTNLAIAERNRPDDPWLRAAELKLNLGLLDLIRGRFEPSTIKGRGVTLRVERRGDGSLEMCDLVKCPPRARSSAAAATEDDSEARSITLQLTESHLDLVDIPTGTSLRAEGIHGEVVWEPRRVTVREVRGRLNGGRFDLAAHLDRGPAEPTFEGQLAVQRAELRPGTEALAYLVPVLGGPNLEGRLDLTLYLQGHGDTPAEVAASLAGQGTITVDPLTLGDSRLVSELAKIEIVPRSGCIGNARSDFTIDDGRISSRSIKVQVGSTPVVLSGWTDFTGRLDYRVHSDALLARLGPAMRDALMDLPQDLEDLVPLRVQGTIRQLTFTIDGVPIDTNHPLDLSHLPPPDKAKLREIGRRLRDRILR